MIFFSQWKRPLTHSFGEFGASFGLNMYMIEHLQGIFPQEMTPLPLSLAENKLARLEDTLVWNSADGQNDLLTGVECRAPSVAKNHQFWRKEAFERAVSIKQKHKFDDIIDDNPKNHSDWQCCDDVKKKVQEPAQGDHLKLSV